MGIASGIILFLISIKMIFSDPSELFSQAPDGEPFIVPLATPLIAVQMLLTGIGKFLRGEGGVGV